MNNNTVCEHKNGYFYTFGRKRFLLCTDCGKKVYKPYKGCDTCKHSIYDKGFPECWKDCSDVEALKSKNSKQLALDRNAFKDCKHYEPKFLHKLKLKISNY